MTTPGTARDAADAFHVYDTTLRDGSQREGLTLSVDDKLAVATYLDDLGVGFIEGGWPGANPKDAAFFRRAAEGELPLRHAQLAAFGATRKAGTVAADDPQVRALLDAQTPVVTLVAKSHVGHVTRALRTTPEENLAMVADTVRFLVAEGRRVFLDAEHFFDGYRLDRDYALAVVRAAAEAGADVVALCDTNGGMLPGPLADVVHEVAGLGMRVGIHAHNDTACAVANSLAAIGAGASHVQGTANGYGERAGNADLFSVVAALELKLDRRVLPDGALAELVRVSHAIAEVANIAPDDHQPWVGGSAFAHKAGLHASALKVDPDLYQHIDPALVGNDMRVLVSELAGRASVELKARELDIAVDRETVGRVIERVKAMEAAGYSFEAAEASFELLLREEVDGERPRFFDLESYRVISENLPSDRGLPSAGSGAHVSEATVKLHVKGERLVATGEGNGPVNALDRALRQALERLHPQLASFELVDYKVRILEGAHGTGAVTRVLVRTSNGVREWDTVGVDENVISASWQALDDAYTFGLLHSDATRGI
ncbi:MAG TPA: citramalate synthase [Mycobacteriales bacterium]|jgi:2-isopropylmalate synthase|nr:citramalate synthase [Mycobacteriales bacterium]